MITPYNYEYFYISTWRIIGGAMHPYPLSLLPCLGKSKPSELTAPLVSSVLAI